MNIPWDHLETFVAVLDQGSFNRAAQALGVGQPTISRRIAALEEHVGDALFERRRTGVEPTAVADRLRDTARRMAEAAGELGRLAERGSSEHMGVVRLAAPPGWSFDILADACAPIRAAHPGIRLHLLSSVHYLDISAGDAHLAIRARPPTEHALTELARIETPVGVFAAPRYRERFGDRIGLAELDWITWAHPFTHLEPYGLLRRTIPDFEPVFASDSYLVQCRAAQAGIGALFASVANAPAYGLVPLPVDLPPFDSTQYVVAATSALRIPRVRVVVDALLAQLRPFGDAIGARIIEP